MSNYIDYRDLADDIHLRIKSKAPSFQFAKFCANPMEEKPSKFPAVLTYWENTETVSEPRYIAQRIDLRRRVTLVSMISVKQSNKDEAFNSLMSLILELKSALLGYQPIVQNARNTWPIFPLNEEYIEISGGELRAILVWAIDIQEITEVDSETFS